MTRAVLLAGLPVTLAVAAAGLLFMSWGLGTLGIWIFAIAVAGTMLVAGQGLPRPVVVPRPGEEEHY